MFTQKKINAIQIIKKINNKIKLQYFFLKKNIAKKREYVI